MLLRADPARALEGGAERERAAVADLVRDGADRGARFEQQVRGQRDPPLGEEGHRRLADERVEAPRERRARDADLVGQRGDRPRPRRVVMDEPQRGPDDGVGVGAVPAGRAGVGTGEPGTQDGDQQQVEQPVEHGLLARDRP